MDTAGPRLWCGRPIDNVSCSPTFNLCVCCNAECHDACQSQSLAVPCAECLLPSQCPCHSLIKYSTFGRKSEQKYLKVYLSHCFVIHAVWCVLCILQMVHSCNVKWVKIIGFCHQQCFFHFLVKYVSDICTFPYSFRCVFVCWKLSFFWFGWWDTFSISCKWDKLPISHKLGHFHRNSINITIGKNRSPTQFSNHQNFSFIQNASQHNFICHYKQWFSLKTFLLSCFPFSFAVLQRGTLWSVF